MREYIKQPTIYVDYGQYMLTRQNILQGISFDQTIPPQANFFGLKDLSTRKTFTLIAGVESEIKLYGIKALGKFLNQMNYLAIYGHTLASTQTEIKITATPQSGTAQNINILPDSNSGICNNNTASTIKYDGFSLFKLEGNLDDNIIFDTISISFISQTNVDLTLDLAGISIGRSFNFPHRVDLNAKISFDQMDITEARTQDGKRITSVNFNGRKKHGLFIPFQNYLQTYNGYYEQNNDMQELTMRTSIANINFQVSYIDDDLLITNYKLPFDAKGYDEQETEVIFENSQSVSNIGSYESHNTLDVLLSIFTYNGQLPFMINTDLSNKYNDNELKNDTFYIVKNKKKSFEFKPISPQIYNIKFDLVEYS